MSSPDQRSRLPILLVLLALVCGACTPAPPPRPRLAEEAPRFALDQVLAAVQRAGDIRTLPADLTPSLPAAATDIGFDNERCEAGPAVDRIEPCVFGDRASARKVVLYGDSHAGMWLPAMAPIAERRHWRLHFFGKPACPAVELSVWNEQERQPFAACDRFRAYVTGWIRAERPDLVVVTSESFARKRERGVLITAAEWQTGLRKLLAELRGSAARVVVLGDTPVLGESAPECLAAHTTDVSACSTSRRTATERVWNAADEAAAAATGSGYVSVLPWLCTDVCPAVIGNITVYRNRFHLSGTYTRTLNGVLENALMEAG